MRAEFMPKEQNHTYEKLYYTLWELAGRYSGFCQFRAVGNSHDDRLIPMLEVGNGAQMIFCVAGIDGTQNLLPRLLIQMAEEYCRAYECAPLESTTYKFAKCLQKRFGIIKGVTDKNYITNSYHVHVTENIDAFDKLALEAKFQALSPGGAISYVEVPDMQNNIDAVIAVMKFIYDNIMYAELNTKSDYCQVCGYDGEIEISENDDGKLVWKCPNCGNTDQDKMNVARRTCGYIGTQFWNQGRTQEIKERVLHL